MVCYEEHHAGDSVDESHSTGTEVEARVSCFEISAFACIIPLLCVLPQSTGLSPRCKNGCQSVRQKAKSCGRGRKRCQFLSTDCSCKPAEKTVLVEVDTWTRKQKANEKNNPCRSSKKVLSKRIPNPLKLSIEGRCAKRG